MGPYNAIPVSKLIDLADKDASVGATWVKSNPGLYEFVQEFIDRGSKPNLSRIGLWLKKFKGRVIGEDENGKYVRTRIASTYNNRRKSEDWFIETLPQSFA